MFLSSSYSLSDDFVTFIRFSHSQLNYNDDKNKESKNSTNSNNVPLAASITLTAFLSRLLLLPISIRALQAQKNTITNVFRIRNTLLKNHNSNYKSGESMNMNKRVSLWESIQRSYAMHLQMVHNNRHNSNGKKHDIEISRNNINHGNHDLYYANPIWVIVSPIVHIPVLVSGLVANRNIAMYNNNYYSNRIDKLDNREIDSSSNISDVSGDLSNQGDTDANNFVDIASEESILHLPDIHQGGLLWFKDLTVPVILNGFK